jgi:nucleotide-binding universal stress UspA family protein
MAPGRPSASINKRKGGVEMQPIVLATDGSPSAERASVLATELASATGSKLCIAAAWESPLTVYPAAHVASIPEVEEEERKRANTAARVVLGMAQAQGVHAESFVREGDAVEVVSEVAGEVSASLVVVGSHGWGPVRRFVFGSVSRALLHEAPCPVLVVRAGESPASKTAETEKEPAAVER